MLLLYFYLLLGKTIVQRKRSCKSLGANFYRMCDISMITLQEFATPTFLKKMGLTLQALISNLWSGQSRCFPFSFISLLISFLEEKVALFHFSWNNFLFSHSNHIIINVIWMTKKTRLVIVSFHMTFTWWICIFFWYFHNLELSE